MTQPNAERRAFLKEYRAEHGHHPTDYKAKTNCTACQVKDLVGHAIIAVNASGEPLKYIEFIDKTGYSNEVKALAKERMDKR